MPPVVKPTQRIIDRQYAINFSLMINGKALTSFIILDKQYYLLFFASIEKNNYNY